MTQGLPAPDIATEAAPEIVALADRAVVFAVDLGGTKVHAALADLGGDILAEIVEPTDRDGGIAVVEQIARLAGRLLEGLSLPRHALLAGAVGCPGVVDAASGRIAMAPNIPGFDAMDVPGALIERLAVPVVVGNDVNFAALGERAKGCCTDIDNFAFVALGTGIGMGLVMDGRLMHGEKGCAGEIAQLPIGTDPYDPANYRLGPLESAIGSAAMVIRYRALGGSVAQDVRGLFDEVNRGCPAAGETLDVTARILFQALLAVKALVDPRLVVLGGSIGLRDELFSRLERIASAHPTPLEIRRSILDTRAVLAGAISVAIADVATPR